MSSPDEAQALRRKLRRIEALLAGATTAGEREAAARARERVLQRMPPGESPLPPPGDGFTELPWAAPGARLPDRAVLLRVLAEWRAGARDAASVTLWAARVVDEQVLPDLPPEHPDAPLVEVLLVLAALRRPSLRPADLKAIRAFLREHPQGWQAAWAAWFAHLAVRRQSSKFAG